MNLNDINVLSDPSKQRTRSSGFALNFNGTTSFVTIGTMGSFGSTIQSEDGFYISFDIKTTLQIGKNLFGKREAGGADLIEVNLNSGNVPGKVTISVGDSSKDTSGNFTDASVVDGAWHTITFQVTLSTNTIVATLDGVSQTVTIEEAETPVNVINFGKAFYLGAKNINNAASGVFLGSLDNVKIGTSVNHLFGSYNMEEGTGTTVADASGAGNTGTLSGTTTPTFEAR